MKRFSLISWDVDGTLYSTAAMRRGVLRRLVSRPWGAPQVALARRFHWAAERSRRGGGDVRQARLHTQRGQSFAVEQAWCGPAITEAGLNPGVLTALATVRGSGLRQVAFSDYRAHYKLRALGIADYFDGVYEGEALGFVKPHPAGFERMCRDYGVTPQQVLHIGDRDATDGAAARAARVTCLILGRDVPDMDALIARLPLILGA